MNAKILAISRRGRGAALALILAFGGMVGTPLTLPAFQPAQAATVSMAVRERLTEYGVWQISRRYGEVWVPSVAVAWRPYTVGRWVWTDDGWYWESSEPFGPVVFHYGRWAYDDDLGWIWIAGDEWAPAWVVWRQSTDYVGWVPAPPPEERVVFRDVWWSFVPVAAIGAVEILPALRPVENNVTIVRNTTIIEQRVVVNNIYNNSTVQVENRTVPINAGPALAALPRPVVAAVRAANLVPPARGSFAPGKLDASKAGEVKRRAASLQPGQPLPVPGKPATAPAGVAPVAPNAAVPTKPNGATAGKPAVTAQPVVPSKPLGNAPAGVAQLPLRKPLPPAAQASSGSPAAKANIVKKKTVQQSVQVHNLPHKPTPPSPAVAQRHRANAAVAQGNGRPPHHAAAKPVPQHQMARVNAPHRPQAAPHKPPPAARKPVKCDPHDPRCKPHG